MKYVIRIGIVKFDSIKLFNRLLLNINNRSEIIIFESYLYEYNVIIFMKTKTIFQNGFMELSIYTLFI